MTTSNECSHEIASVTIWEVRAEEYDMKDAEYTDNYEVLDSMVEEVFCEECREDLHEEWCMLTNDSISDPVPWAWTVGGKANIDRRLDAQKETLKAEIIEALDGLRINCFRLSEMIMSDEQAASMLAESIIGRRKILAKEGISWSSYEARLRGES